MLGILQEFQVGFVLDVLYVAYVRYVLNCLNAGIACATAHSQA